MAASTNIILRCIIAGVAEKKSSLPFGVCSNPRVVHRSFPRSIVVHSVHPLIH